jgi:hypothetical protein
MNSVIRWWVALVVWILASACNRAEPAIAGYRCQPISASELFGSWALDQASVQDANERGGYDLNTGNVEFAANGLAKLRAIPDWLFDEFGVGEHKLIDDVTVNWRLQPADPNAPCDIRNHVHVELVLGDQIASFSVLRSGVLSAALGDPDEDRWLTLSPANPRQKDRRL